jgi:hypothetical protein
MGSRTPEEEKTAEAVDGEVHYTALLLPRFTFFGCNERKKMSEEKSISRHE